MRLQRTGSSIRFKRESLSINNSISPHRGYWSRVWPHQVNDFPKMRNARKAYVTYCFFLMELNEVCFHAGDIGTRTASDTFRFRVIREAGPFLLVTVMPSYLTGPALGVRTQLPHTSMAWALSVHGDSQYLFNLMRRLNGPPQSKDSLERRTARRRPPVSNLRHLAARSETGSAPNQHKMSHFSRCY